jgi:diguanylate cyclase (GGDEF)-like protein
MRSFLLILLTLFWVMPAGAGEIVISDAVDRQFVHSSIELLEDRKGVLWLEDVTSGASSSGFHDAGENYFSLGFSHSVYWYRFTLNNPYPQSRTRILGLDVAWLDKVELYIPEPSGAYKKIEMGDQLPFDQRAISHHHFLNKLTIPPGSTTYLMRVKTSDPFMTPITLRAPADFDEQEWKLGVYYGAFYGALLMMFLYNGIIFLSIRDRRYFFYCLFLASFLLMNFSYNGFAYQYLWPGATQWVNWSYGVFIALFQITGLLFAISFLNPRKRMPRIYTAMTALILFLITVLPLSYYFGLRVLYNMAPIYAIFVYAPLVALAGILALLQGFRAARFFVLASLATLVGAFISALTVAGFLPYSFLTFHAVEFGLLADMILLSLAMADRINLARIEREIVLQRAMDKELAAKDLMYQATESLEQTVAHRTEDLLAAKEEAEQLARIDVLTGIANRRAFQEIAREEYTRTQRHNRDLAVIVFDLDHFKHINDSFGHQAGDLVINHAARLATDTVREIDTVGRTGGEEFAILLPETDIVQAEEIAERLRDQMERSLVIEDDREISYTSSFGLALVEEGDDSTDLALKRADVALYASKNAGRNRVTIWNKSLVSTD